MLSFREKILRSCRQLAEWTDKEGEEGKEYCSISTYLICLFRLYVAILVQYATTNSKHTYKVLYRSATSPSLSAWSVHLAKLPTQTGYGTYGGTADGTNCCFLYWAVLWENEVFEQNIQKRPLCLLSPPSRCAVCFWCSSCQFLPDEFLLVWIDGSTELQNKHQEIWNMEMVSQSM